MAENVTQGALRIVKEDGTIIDCPLQHTDVTADVSGFIARVRVRQTFYNPTDEKIEAVYVFPLPHQAAVDDMTMVVGQRRIVGVVKRRAEARQIYEQALMAGQTAALLEQERPNIFTQSVGNIDPGQQIDIEISYVDVLRYDMGTYEFSFPMVVGPRYIPGTPTGAAEPRPLELQGKVSPPVPNTTRVPDASRISPPVLRPELRNGHDVTLSVQLDAGVPIQNMIVANHKATVERSGQSEATVKLSPDDSIPNKDFVLRYGVVGNKPELALLAHTGDYSDEVRTLGRGYFMLMIQPKEDDRLTKSPPREIVFLLDVSGSMSGEPTAEVVQAIQSMLKLCRANDTVQVITFASQAQQLFDRPVPVNDENIRRALNFTEGLQGRGGTEMLKGVKMAIDQPIDPERVRIVVMLTDGYIGNEAEIIEHVGTHCGDQVRFWAIGIGSSPNMFLIEGVARQGGGMGKQLGLTDDTDALTTEVMTRIQRAQLANVKIDWGELKVVEIYPARIPELWAGRPVILFGRYAGGGSGTITVSGTVEGQSVSWPLEVDLPENEPAHDVLAKVWARQAIEDLMQQSYYHGSPAVEEMVTGIALDYRLMSQYTSFVAVDEQEAKEIETQAVPPRRMLVPVPLPEGTRWEGFFGEERGSEKKLEESVTRGIMPLNRAEPSDGVAACRLPARSSALAQGRPQSEAAGPTPSGSVLGKPGYLRRAGTPELRRQARFRGGLGGGAFYHAASPAPPALSASTPVAADAAFVPLYAFGFARDKAAGAMARAVDLVASAIGQKAPVAPEAGRQAFEAARKELERDRLEAARRQLLEAYFLDTAAYNFGHSDGQVAGDALTSLQDVHRRQVRAWASELPALDKRLDVILRDRSLSDALSTVAEAAGIEIRTLPGSVQDAAALLMQDELRVTYLDLRGATVAQALDWMLQPLRMTWWPTGPRVNVGTERRRAGQSAWVYDVSLISVPLDEELGKVEDYDKAVQNAQKAADEFVSRLRSHLGIPARPDRSLVWFGPGQVLVVGGAKLHASVAEVLSQLGNPQAKVANDLAQLHRVTSKRARQREGVAAKLQVTRRRMQLVIAHTEFAWQLLAAAAQGKLDLEALTELEIAWQAFRADSRDLLGDQPLAGHVIVLVNRLSNSPLVIAAR